MNDVRSFFLFAVLVALTGCDTMNKPISTGDFDPLMPPGNKRGVGSVESTGFVPGQFVSAALDNTSFFKKKPKGDANADKLLKAGTQMKVVSAEDSYLKVELDSGEVGYVPSILVTDPNAVPSSREVQVYPPLPGSGDIGNVPIVPLEQGGPQTPANETLPAVIEPGNGAKPETPATEGTEPKAPETPKQP